MMGNWPCLASKWLIVASNCKKLQFGSCKVLAALICQLFGEELSARQVLLEETNAGHYKLRKRFIVIPVVTANCEVTRMDFAKADKSYLGVMFLFLRCYP